MSYLELEKEFDRAIVFLVLRAAERETLPAASLLHSIRVGLYLQQSGASREVVLAGLLHDIIEDTHATEKDVKDHFGSRVAELVSAMTVKKELDSQAGNRDSVDRCQRLGRDALIIKAADLVDNLHFYLAEAKPERYEQLADSLTYFLDASLQELEQHEAWNEIKRQRDKVLDAIAQMNQAH